jgi:hypothetical protein
MFIHVNLGGKEEGIQNEIVVTHMSSTAFLSLSRDSLSSEGRLFILTTPPASGTSTLLSSLSLQRVVQYGERPSERGS